MKLTSLRAILNLDLQGAVNLRVVNKDCATTYLVHLRSLSSFERQGI